LAEEKAETKKIFCNTCQRQTNHLLKARFSLNEDMTEDKYGFEGDRYERGWDPEECYGIHVHRYSLWSCAGCTTPTAEWQGGVEANVPGNFELQTDSAYFPARLKGSIQAKAFRKLRDDMARLYMEVVACFNTDCLLLCTIGLRSLLEAICSDKGVADGNLEQRVNGLVKFLPSLNILEALHSVRITGNFAAHRLEPLSRNDAAVAIEVVEDLLSLFYDLDYKASRVRNPMRGGSRTGSPDTVQ
jgi:hypothetical protein